MTHSNYSGLPDNSLFPEAYSIEKLIHESAVSSLYLGFDKDINSNVVIKCFKTSAKGAYLREIGAAFDLQHPNLVACLHTFHRTDGIACIVYEYLAGGSLLVLLEQQKPVALATIYACLLAMLHALAYLHSVNRIHCDLKPENILLRPKADGQVDFVLIDLGAACFLREAQEGHHVTGTPAYIAPERLKNRFYFNSDLYSLGVIAYEMALGERPFTGSLEELTQANISHILSLSAIQPSVLRDFIDHLLVKNPNKRLTSAELALKLLNKAITQTNQRISNPFLIAESSYAQWVVPIVEEPSAIHCFHINDYQLIGLVYSHFVEIFDPLQHENPYKVLLTSYPLQILGDDMVVYATPSRIQLLSLNDSSELLVREQLHDLNAWYLQHGRLIWSNSYYTFYDNFNGDSIIKIGTPSNLFSSEASVFENGHFVTSEGMANNKIVLRNENAQPIEEWQLNNPVVALTHHHDTVLVITLEMQADVSYTLWSLTAGLPAQKLALPNAIGQIICVNGGAFWVFNKRELFGCDTSLNPKTLMNFASSVFNFAISYDHSFVVIGYNDDEHNPFLTILKNRAFL